MKKLQKLALPVLIVIVILLIYKIYFSGAKGLGSFSDFDPNNNAVKPITVRLVQDRGINQQGGSVVFFASDMNGQVVQIYGEFRLPDGFENAEIVTVKGHLTQSGFHAHEAVLK